jgi:PAS domain S-box-containing protein
MRNIQIDYNKILFVEYESKLSEQINLLLKDEYNLIFVNSNAELSFAFQLDPPDLILLDYADKKSLSQIQEDENSKDIPILFLHDIEGEEIEEVYTLERICETIYKPRIQFELLMRLKRVIHISRQYKELKRIKLDLEIDLKVQHLIESELTEKENRLATILDSVEAFIYIKDTHYRYQYANKKVCDMFGLPMDEIINKDDFDFFDETTAKNLRQNDRRIIDYGERIEEEEINTGKNGNITNAFLSVKLPLFREDGTVYALSGISTEITKHKQAEDRLKKTSSVRRAAHSIEVNASTTGSSREDGRPWNVSCWCGT